MPVHFDARLNGWTAGGPDVRPPLLPMSPKSARSYSNADASVPNGPPASTLDVRRPDEAALNVVEPIAPAVDAEAAGFGLDLGRLVVVGRAMERDGERLAVEDGELRELVRALARCV